MASREKESTSIVTSHGETHTNYTGDIHFTCVYLCTEPVPSFVYFT